VKVRTGVKKESVTEGRDGRLLVAVSAKREAGKANERLREVLAAHFGLSVDAVVIRHGKTSATKTVLLRA
jgi:uncharacterized protein YggU (UPF0235/DUF167 family)